MPDDTLELELTAMTHRGSALGRHNDRAIFVPYTVPGERITARITQEKAASPTPSLSPSLRLPRYAQRCGGCHWQHMDYSAQLQFKQQVVIDQMARIGGFRDVPVHPTIPSSDPWYYRSRITLHVTADGQPGFVSIDGRTVIPIEECHIIRPELLEMLQALKTRLLQNASRARLQVGMDEHERLTAPMASIEAVAAFTR